MSDTRGINKYQPQTRPGLAWGVGAEKSEWLKMTNSISLLFEFNGVAKWNLQDDSYDQQAFNMTNNLSCI